MMKVGITGGMGSGKSTVCRLFAQKGIAVYDSDAAAKRLMQEDGALRRQLAGRFGEGTFRNGVLDRGLPRGHRLCRPAGAGRPQCIGASGRYA